MTLRARNLLFHGKMEAETKERITEELDTQKDILFLRWPLPFKTFRLDRLDIGPLPKKPSTDDKETFCLDSFLRDSQSQAKYIVLEDLHILAHSRQDPGGFYRELLGACNFYHRRHGISFILSCARIPVVFVRENPFGEDWDFIDCNARWVDPGPDGDALWRDLLLSLRQVHPQAAWHHVAKLRESTGAPSPEDLTKDPSLHDRLRAMIASDSLFHSDVYILDHPFPEDYAGDAIDRIQAHLESIIIGQSEAIQKVFEATLLAYHEPAPDIRTRPKAVFLFVGPSGVGKTRICQEMARLLPGYRFLQINLAEHNDQAGVNKLIGLGRGYEDSEYGGILTEPVRLYPRHVILFDELDHAHPSVLHLFYKLFEGEIMDGRGRVVSFRDCFIIMTTNKGQLSQRLPAARQRRAVEEALMKEEKGSGKEALSFTEAFLGRIDSVVPFFPLKPFDMARIAENYFRETILIPFEERYGIRLSLRCEPQPELMRKGILSVESAFFEIWALLAIQDPEQGARKLFQLMDEYLIKPLKLFAIRYRRLVKPGFEIMVRFSALWPPVADYDETTLLLIDDDPGERERLVTLVNTDGICIVWSDFEGIRDLSDVSIILLDLLRDGEMVWKGALSRIGVGQLPIPVCSYSALCHGPHLDHLKSSLWEHGFFDHIEKNQSAETMKEQILAAIRESYLMRKAAAGQMIERVDLEPPFTISPGDRSAQFTMQVVLS